MVALARKNFQISWTSFHLLAENEVAERIETGEKKKNAAGSDGKTKRTACCWNVCRIKAAS